MNEEEFANELKDIIDLATDADVMEEIDVEPVLQVVSIRSFDEAALLTSDKGLVIRLKDGQEFQVTIKRSR